jgi:hypothetical protein
MKRKFMTMHLQGGTGKPTFVDYECRTCIFFKHDDDFANSTDNKDGTCFCEPITVRKDNLDWCDFYQPDTELIEGGI